MNATQSDRTKRKRAQRRQTLIEAARGLFMKQGYNGTTIDEIAAEADVAKVTVYSYFKSKEDIALEIKRQATEEALEYVDSFIARDLPPDQMIESLINDIEEWTTENWRLLDVFCTQRFAPLLERDSNEECKPEPITLCMIAIIEKGQDSGHFRSDIDTCQVAHMIDIAILCEQYHWVRSGRPSDTLKQRLEKCFDFVLNGIREKQ